MTKNKVSFSIVMPSYLGKYKGAAKDRDKKLRRAIDSVLAQTYQDWELIVIADGCEKTVSIVKTYRDKRIKGYLIPKQATWDGSQRNTGIYKATKEYIIYLDIDDVYEPDYLENLANEMNDKLDWYYVDDIGWDKDKNKFFIHNNELEHTKCGTSTIIHKKDLDIYWARGTTYSHDWIFIQRLMSNSNSRRKLNTVGYKVMHVPYRYDL